MPLSEKVRELLANAEWWHAAYHKAATFTGPSLYFHLRALETRDAPTGVRHLENSYAMLAAWGMHRMGKRGSKVQDFQLFRESVEKLGDEIVQAQRFDPQAIDDGRWFVLGKIFRGLKVMASGTALVGNSKVMHHMMPGIIPPIDREYTLRFLRGNTNIANDPDREWDLMRGMIEGFFIPVACDTAFRTKAQAWLADAATRLWDRSVMKVIDNLIVGSRK
jgi:hypothetical protein